MVKAPARGSLKAIDRPRLPVGHESLKAIDSPRRLRRGSLKGTDLPPLRLARAFLIEIDPVTLRWWRCGRGPRAAASRETPTRDRALD